MSATVPSSFRGAYADLAPTLEMGRQYLESRLKAELHELHPVLVETRVKEEQSAYAKIQKGDFKRLLEVDDLIAARAVFLHPASLETGLSTARVVFPVISEKNIAAGRPTDF